MSLTARPVSHLRVIDFGQYVAGPAAACGQYSDMGLNRVLMGINPSFSPLPLASALIEGLAYNSQGLEDDPERYKSNREKEIDRRKREDVSMGISYSDLQEFLDPFYRSYPCADGRQVYVVSAPYNKHPERVLRRLGIWDQLVKEGLPLHDAYRDVADWPDSSTLHSYPLSQCWADRVSGLMKAAFLTKNAFEWENIFGEAGAPASAQRTTAEWLKSDHALASGLVLKTVDPQYGEMSQLGPLAWMAHDAENAATPSTRKLVNATEIADHKPVLPDTATSGQVGWLDGAKILDLTNVIAGPTIGSTLARFGAEVISINPVKPSMDPWNGIIFGMHAGRGKETVLMDLKPSQTHPAFDEPSGCSIRGASATYRTYKARDAWFFLAMGRDELTALEGVTALPLCPLSEGEIISCLEGYFAGHALADIVKSLQAANIAAQPLAKMHAVRGAHITIPNAIPSAMRKPGSDSRSVMARFGDEKDQIENLIQAGQLGRVLEQKTPTRMRKL